MITRLKLTLLLVFVSTYIFAQQLIVNGDIENGPAGWTREYALPSQNYFWFGRSNLNQCTPHSGINYCWYGQTNQSYANPYAYNVNGFYQEFVIPVTATSCTLEYYYMVATDEPTTQMDNDILNIALRDTNNNVLYNFEDLTNNTPLVRRSTTPDCTNSWLRSVFNIPSQFFGQRVRLYFSGYTIYTNINGTMFRLDDISVIATGPVSIDDVHTVNVQVYPNPVTNELVVNSSDLKLQYTIKSLTGNTIITGVLKTNTINVADLAPGIYSLELIGKHINTIKIIKQ